MLNFYGQKGLKSDCYVCIPSVWLHFSRYCHYVHSLWLNEPFTKQPNYHCIQGDQIGRIFAQWVIVCFGQLHIGMKITESADIFGLLYSTVKIKH
jgi:hypothetical protein